MGNIYSVGENRIFYKAANFGTGKTVTAYLWNPNMVKSALQTFTEIDSGLYYLDYDFDIEGNYVGVFYEDAVQTAFYVFRVTVLAQNVWEYTDRKLTSALTDEVTPKDMAAIGVGGGVTLPVMQTGVYQLTATQNTTISISRGDGPIKTYFDFGADYSGWTPYFGMKIHSSDSTYQINPKTAIWTDATRGQGYFELTTTETNRVGRFIGEIELRKSNDRFTPLRFMLKFEEDVIDTT